MILWCTKRLLALIDAALAGLREHPASDGDCNATLLWLDRQKCLLLTHAGTLFSVLLARVRKSDLRPIGSFVVDAIESALRAEQLPIETFGLLDADNVQIAKTADRRTLGFMNELAHQVRYDLVAGGGLSECDLDGLNHRLRRTLLSKDGYSYPIELALQQVGR